jgi:hypothetical protein
MVNVKCILVLAVHALTFSSSVITGLRPTAQADEEFHSKGESL